MARHPALARTATCAAVVVAALTGSAGLAQAAPAATTGGYWAAIAVSVRTGNVGYAYDSPTSSGAESAARAKCGAGDCTVVVRVTNGCAAVAQARNLAWGSGWAGSRADAERQAITHTPGKGARTIAWTCTTR